MTITRSIELEEHTCGTCGIEFAVPKYWIENRRRTAGSITCPNGCRRSWNKSEADLVREQLAEVQRQLTAAKCNAMEMDRLRAIAVKNEAESKRKVMRAESGVCTCCNRSFQNLARHMKTKHPKK